MTTDMENQIARHLFSRFNEFYDEFRGIPGQAKTAFEKRYHRESLRLSNLRLSLYSRSIKREGGTIVRLYPQIKKHEDRWDGVERCFNDLAHGVYHADLALAYLHSIRRKIFISEWRVEDYSADSVSALDEKQYAECYYPVGLEGQVSEEMVKDILGLEGFEREFEDIQRDAGLVIERLRRNLRLDQAGVSHPQSFEFFRAGFYRNRGAYLVGRFNYEDGRCRPFILALLNGKAGIYVDAVITSSTYAHNMFSSTLANFHVTNDYYHELCLFLKSIMPMRPLGLHYSTIGYNHLGKVAVMREMEEEIRHGGELLSISPGARGTVAIGFTTPQSSYHAKVIRNIPTDNYKWDKFQGVNSVLKKYTQVHEINRSDSMLDSIIFYKLRLPKKWFDDELLAELLGFAHHSIEEEEKTLLFRYLIVQRKLTPLPVYLETASEKQAETIMANLGYCIKNNAAANIFNKDLDARNYGVTTYSKVYLYDYDAIEVLGDVKVRTNLDRLDGEEDIPDWYFEDGFIFLPEELPSGLCLSDRRLRRVFEDRHRELLTRDYWEDIQNKLAGGKVPRVSVYPDSERISSY